jgi:hypothetical protein
VEVLEMSEKKKKVRPGKVKVGRFETVPANSTVANVSMASAMKQLGRSMGHVYRCILDGRLPAFKVGRSTVFRQVDLDKLMAPVPWVPPTKRVTLASRAEKALKERAAGKGKVKNPARKKETPRSLKASVAKALEGMTVEAEASRS